MKALKIFYPNDLLMEFDYIEFPDTFEFNEGIKVIVEKDTMYKIAVVVNVVDLNELANKVNFIRVANKKDLVQEQRNINDSSKILLFAQEKAVELNLDMHFISAFYTYDRKQLFISYTADSRIDFRELAKILAQKYKTRIELRQIGVRDRAKVIGGIGPCGLFLCCSKFLNDFVSVSINMAKNQFLALNPTKINGLCGRLLCCLNYENEVYTELKKGLPSLGSLIECEEGLGKVVDVDVFRKTYKIELKNKTIVEKCCND